MANKNNIKSKIELFKKLGEYNEEKGITRIVCKNEFVNDYKDLYFSNGGTWCRRSLLDKGIYKFATATGNGKINILCNVNDEERLKIINYFKEKCNFSKENGNHIKYFIIFGKKELNNFTRLIRKDILEYYRNKACVNCGSSTELQCDHKNGLYNNGHILKLISYISFLYHYFFSIFT